MRKLADRGEVEIAILGQATFTSRMAFMVFGISVIV